MLKYYRRQDNVEKGFRFLKSDTFSISKVYLKNKARIEALTMIMVLCLMIYSIAEWKLRIKLEELNETVPDQKGNPTKRPTMRWIFFKFQGMNEKSHFLYFFQNKSFINLYTVINPVIIP
jgi:transposase